MAGHTRTSLARELGCATWTISRICNGDEPGTDLAKKIIRLSKNAVTWDDLYPKPPKPADEAAA